MSKKYVVPSIFTAVDKFSGPVNKMSRNAESSMARMERKFRKVGDRAFSISRQSAMVGAAIIGPMGLMANAAVKFEEKMANISTLVDTSKVDMVKMGEEVLKLSKRMPVPIDELTGSMYGLISAGVDAADTMNFLEVSGKLATAGLATTEESSKLLTGAINTFKSEGLTAQQTADILFKTVKAGINDVSQLTKSFGANAAIIEATGVKFADLQAATAALTTTTTPASVAQTQLKAAMVSLQGPTADLENVFEELGVTTGRELLEKSGSLGEAFKMITEESERSGVNLKKVMGSSEALAAVMSITGATNEAYVKTLDDMVHGSDALNEAYDKQAKTGKNSMQIAKNNMQALSITLGTTLIPIINDLVSAVTPVIEKFSTWVSENRGTVKTIMKVAAVVGGLALAVSAVSLVVGVATKAFAIYKYGMLGYNAVMKAAKMAQLAFNVALNNNPIGLFIGVALAAAAAFAAFGDSLKTQTREQRLNEETQKRATENTVAQRAEVKMLFAQLRKLNPESDAYNEALRKLEKIQPGITEQYGLQWGKIDALRQAESDLTDQIMKRALVQARASQVEETAQKVIELEDRLEGKKTQSNLEAVGNWFKLDYRTEDRIKEQLEAAKKDLDFLTTKQAAAMESGEESRVSNPAKAQSINTSSMISSSVKETFELTAGEDLKGLLMLNRKNGNGGGGLAMPGVPNTN